MQRRLQEVKDTAEILLRQIKKLEDEVATATGEGNPTDTSGRTQLSVSYPAPVPLGVTDASSRVSVSRPRRTATITPEHANDAISVSAARSIVSRGHITASASASASFEEEDFVESNDGHSRQRRPRGDQHSALSDWTDGVSRSSRVAFPK